MQSTRHRRTDSMLRHLRYQLRRGQHPLPRRLVHSTPQVGRKSRIWKCSSSIFKNTTKNLRDVHCSLLAVWDWAEKWAGLRFNVFLKTTTTTTTTTTCFTRKPCCRRDNCAIPLQISIAYVSNFTTTSCGYPATARLSCWSLSADCSESSVKKW